MIGGVGGVGDDAASAHQIGNAPAKKVEVVDTAGAEEAFVGALVSALNQGATPATAVELGSSALTAAVQQLGAQPPESHPKS